MSARNTSKGLLVFAAIGALSVPYAQRGPSGNDERSIYEVSTSVRKSISGSVSVCDSQGCELIVGSSA